MFSMRTDWNRRPNRLTVALGRLQAEGRTVMDLTRSNPTECGFAYDLKRIGQALTGEAILEYRPHERGLPAAREAVETYYGRRGQLLVSKEDLVLTSGTSEGYSFLFRLLCNAGDEVLIPAPGYPLFEFLADLSDVKLVRFPLLYDHGWQMDFTALAALVTERTRAVIVVHPNNPTGHYVSNLEQAALGKFCRERGIALIADEVFLDFAWRADPAPSFSGSDRALTFTLSGLSKICGLPQMKLGWIAVSGPQAEKSEALARLEVIADTYLSVGTPVQLAARELLETRDGFHGQVMTRVRANLAELDRQLARQAVSTRLECEGGWMAVLRVPALASDEELAVRLLEERGVLVHPGHFYDFARPGYLVLSLLVPELEFAQGITRLLAHFTD